MQKGDCHICRHALEAAEAGRQATDRQTVSRLIGRDVECDQAREEFQELQAISTMVHCALGSTYKLTTK